jgi:hypothetical protein
MFDDFKELLSVFNAHNVRYLVVGGYAVSFHAQPRATKDLDLFIKADQANAAAVYASLASFGAPLEHISVEELSDPRKFIRFGREPVAVDILPSIDGVAFDEAWERRVEGGAPTPSRSRLGNTLQKMTHLPNRERKRPIVASQPSRSCRSNLR